MNASDPPKFHLAHVDIRYLIRALLKYGASDLHIKADRPPLYRINGQLVPSKLPALSPEQVKKIIGEIITPKQTQDLESRCQIDFSFQVDDLGRYRCNAFKQKGVFSAVIRAIPLAVPILDDLGVPKSLKDLCHRNRGLILISGATGSGKSTTLAGMVGYINQTRPVHVLTLEDPIEFLYRDDKASITQRELGSDIHSFADGLYAGLRQDPDVIVIGELRQPEVIETALRAAETGHLVLSTIHTGDSKSAIERLIESFPGTAQDQIRMLIASNLAAILCQHLVNKMDGSRLLPATELLIKSPMIEDQIRKKEIHLIPDSIANSNQYYKMHTLNQDLNRLVKNRLISTDEALKTSNNPEDLKLLLEGIKQDVGFDINSSRFG